ncbi:MAG: hypothetical protein AAGI88_09075 [Pseudomonadota bacterium]
MARPLDANTAQQVDSVVTSPHWFVRLGFDTPIHLTTAESVEWAAQGAQFVKADLRVRGGASPTLRIFNELLALGVTVLTERPAGRAVSIWLAYQDPTASSSLPGFAEPILLFEGVMGEATIDAFVTIRCTRTGTQYSPRRYVMAPLFNHLPRRGQVIEMPNQKITLE